MKKYFLNVNGETVGPYSVNELRSMNIQPSTLIWYTGSVNWKKANSIPELQSLFNSDPFSVSDRPKQYNPPRTRSTSFTQFNFEPEQPAKSPNLKIGLIIGIVVVCIACGFGYYLEKQKQLMETSFQDIQSSLDSANENQLQDIATADSLAVEEAAPEITEETSQYTGEYDNLKGGIISITGSDNELKIDLKYNIGTGEKCAGEITGTGKVLDATTVSMTTDDGCNLKLTFRSRYTIAVEESGTCIAYHAKHCLFDGVYYGQ